MYDIIRRIHVKKIPKLLRGISDRSYIGNLEKL